jgi:hypothetical protein
MYNTPPGQVERRRAVKGVHMPAGGLGGNQQLAIYKEAQSFRRMTQVGRHWPKGIGG